MMLIMEKRRDYIRFFLFTVMKIDFKGNHSIYLESLLKQIGM